MPGSFARPGRGGCAPPPYTPQARSGPQDPRATSEIFMTTSVLPARLDLRRRPFGMPAMAIAVAATLLVGCGDKNKEKAATQTAAKVNKEEITVHQINFLLAQQRGLRPGAGSLGEPRRARAPDRPGARASEGRPSRSSTAIRASFSRSKPRGARSSRAPTSTRSAEGAPKPTPAEVAAVLRSAPRAVQGAARLQPPGGQRSRRRRSRSSP